MNNHLDILTSLSGIKITNTSDWERFRRPELMMLLEDFVYGARPYETPDRIEFTVKRYERNHLGTGVDYKAIDVCVNGVTFPVDLFLPSNRFLISGFMAQPRLMFCLSQGQLMLNFATRE